MQCTKVVFNQRSSYIPDGTQGNELSRRNLSDRHLLQRENDCVLVLISQPGVHLYGIS